MLLEHMFPVPGKVSREEFLPNLGIRRLDPTGSASKHTINLVGKKQSSTRNNGIEGMHHRATGCVSESNILLGSNPLLMPIIHLSHG